ncbi:MAG: PilZ domain protein [Syntrophus sp. PtaB.Bin001]|nr:MAG: PilZ domain protein [Syntrophus sp. PtaB.Bin001]
MQNVSVDEKGQAWITCDSCKHTSIVDLSNHGAGVNIMNYKCLKCGTEFEVTCEFRKFYRKEVGLNGTFIQQKPLKEQAGRIEIIDISRIGLKFKTRVNFDFKPGYILKLTFTLNNRNKTILNQLIEVKWVSGQIVGGEFINMDQWTRQQLGFYFMT